MRAARLTLLALVTVVTLGACGGSGGGDENGVRLEGAGSSLVYPLATAWSRDYDGANVVYSAAGSGSGIHLITTRSIDFGASDAPLTPAQAAACNGCVQIPWALSATALSYRLDGAPGTLRLSGPVLADIYLGKITHWNDPKIASLNPGAQLPDQAITPVFRSDDSGDTYAFTSYLSKISHAWKRRVGTGTSVDFPVGVGSNGNGGVAGTISRTDGALGFIGVAYAAANELRVASIRNAGGRFVAPTLDGIAAAASAMSEPRRDNAISIVDPPASAPEAYPISTFTYAIVPRGSPKASELQRFLTYAIGPGQRFGADLYFAELPPQVVALNRKAIASLG